MVKGNTTLLDAMNAVLSGMTVEDFNTDHERGDCRSARDLRCLMDKLAQTHDQDIGTALGARTPALYLTGIRNTLVLAVVATLIGCVIGLLCGILNTIPYTQQDPPGQALLAEAAAGVDPDLCGGVPGHAHGAYRRCSSSTACPTSPTARWPSQGMGGIWVAAIIVVSINTGAYMAEIRPGRHHLH